MLKHYLAIFMVETLSQPRIVFQHSVSTMFRTSVQILPPSCFSLPVLLLPPDPVACRSLLTEVDPLLSWLRSLILQHVIKAPPACFSIGVGQQWVRGSDLLQVGILHSSLRVGLLYSGSYRSESLGMLQLSILYGLSDITLSCMDPVLITSLPCRSMLVFV